MDIYARIKQDHDHFRELFRELCGGKLSSERRDALFDELKRGVWTHNKIEEAIFYNPLMDRRKTRGESLEALNEHHISNTLIEEMESIPKDNEMWASKLGVLKENLDHHMQEEESEVFEEARKVLSDDRAKEMGEDFDRRKKMGLEAITP